MNTPLASPALSHPVLNLAGTWGFALDPRDQGMERGWSNLPLPTPLAFPTSLTVAGIGDPVGPETPWTGQNDRGGFDKDPRYAPYREPGKFKIPYWLQPETVFVGAAWYSREVVLPVEWVGKQIVLFMERPHIQVKAWWDGKDLGTENSLGTPHGFTVGPCTQAGVHRLTLCIDNRDPVGIGHNSHSLSDHTQGNWNGAVGRLELRAVPLARLASATLDGHVENRSLTATLHLLNDSDETLSARITLTAAGEGILAHSKTVDLSLTPGATDSEIQLELGKSAALWDEFHPHVHQLTVRVETSAGVDETRHRFGLRKISAQGNQLLMNGRPLFLRGTLECCVFPKTGHPPTDLESWRRIYRIVKAHGLNHVRFHSWCPPEAAFDGADEAGVYLQVECSSWPNSDTTVGDGKPVDAWLYKEGRRILAHFGNHPSFILMLHGNEPGGQNHKAYLAEWVKAFKAEDPRRLYTSGAGWPQIPGNDFHCTPDPRVQGWGQGLASRINALPPETETDYRSYIDARSVPVVSHEIGQWCVYPDLDERKKYTGPLKAKNFDIFQDLMVQNGLEDLAADFLLASGKLQTLCYKEEIESALRTPAMGGFQLLGLNDFPGQGTALVGVLDPFWDSKPYVSPAQFNRFCRPTTPLLRLQKRVFASNETLPAWAEVSHFGDGPLAVEPAWAMVDESGRCVMEGNLPPSTVPVGAVHPLGELNLDISRLPSPAKYRLELSLGNGEQPNDWDVWVYPARQENPAVNTVHVTAVLDGKTTEVLMKGGTVVWNLAAEQVRPPEEGPVALGFSTVFWNTAWTNNQPPHTLGLFCDPKHPLFKDFPTDSHTNWQWWYLLHLTAALHLDPLPKEVRPTVQVIDTWFKARRLGLVVEAQVGPGKILVTSIPLEAGDVVSRQFKKSLLVYVQGMNFMPRANLSLENLRKLQKE